MRASLVAVLLVILSIVINISAIHTNRLKSDSIHFKENIINTKYSQERNEVLDKAKNDHFRDEYGYASENGQYTINNFKEEYQAVTEYDFIRGLPIFYERIYLESDVGSIYYGNLPKSDWLLDIDICEWDGINLSVDISEENVTYLIKEFSITESNTYEYDEIYKLDYYLPVTTSDYQPTADGKPKILVKLKNNSVVGYNILNPNLEKYQYLIGYDINGIELFKMVKNYEEKLIPKLVGTEQFYLQSTGHLVKFLFPQSILLNLQTDNPLLTEIKIDGYTDIYEEENLKIDLDLTNTDSVEVLIFETVEGEDLNLRVSNLDFSLTHIIKE